MPDGAGDFGGTGEAMTPGGSGGCGTGVGAGTGEGMTAGGPGGSGGGDTGKGVGGLLRKLISPALIPLVLMLPVLMLPPVLSRVILPALPVKVEVSRFPAAMSPDATRASSPPFEVMDPA